MISRKSSIGLSKKRILFESEIQESQIEKIGYFGDYIREDRKTRKTKDNTPFDLFFSTDFDQALSRAREEELRERAQSIKGF